MEPFIADLINNSKVSKILRYIIVIILCSFIIILGISCIINSPFILVNIFGIRIVIIFLIIGIYLNIKIYRCKKLKD